MKFRLVSRAVPFSVTLFIALLLTTGAIAQDSSGVHLIGYTRGSGTPADVTLVDNLMYCTQRAAGIAIYQISDLSNPVLLGSYPTSEWANHVTLNWPYAITGNGNAGVRVFNIMNAVSPVPVSTYSTGGFTSGATYSNNNIYVTDYSRGLMIFNFEDPASPRLLGSCTLSGQGFLHVNANPLIYIAAGYGGLDIVNVANPAQPYIFGHATLGGHAYGVALYIKYAYVADGSAGVKIVDVSIPQRPQVVGTVPTPDLANALCIDRGILYVTAYGSGLFVYRLDHPEHPRLVGHYNTHHYYQGVNARDSIAFLANASNGFYIVDCREAILNGFGNTGVAPYNQVPISYRATAYPNPSNGSITFTLPSVANNPIRIYDALGTLRRTIYGPDQKAVWDLRDNYGGLVTSGAYFARMPNGQTVPLRIVK